MTSSHGDLGMTVVTDLSFDDAEAAIRTALADVGFGILTEIDVAATLKAKIDVDRSPYKILGACNPALANRALNFDESIGLLLPCNVTISATENGTVVSVIDPNIMLGIAGDAPEMRAIAAEARVGLEAALSNLQVRN